ncbi:MAG: tetratricopeptide repeat protein [Pseudomonadota bacterium]
MVAVTFAMPSVAHAQSGDAAVRVLQLEDEVRRLNGKLEELTFQLLQLQEQIRKMQQDNELRFQELEDKTSSQAPAGQPKKDVAGGTKRLEKPAPSASANAADANPATPSTVDQAKKTEPKTTLEPTLNSDDLTLNTVDATANNAVSVRKAVPTVAETAKPTVANPSAPKTTASTQTPDGKPAQTATRDLTPKALGTLTFDAKGNVVSAGRPIYSDQNLTRLPGVFSDGVDGGIEAAEYGPTPSSVLKAGQIALRNNRIDRAEGAFRAFLKAWPKDPDVPTAKTLLAQSLFQKQQYFDAANIFLDTHNAHPNNRMGADNLLGLGLSLAGLNQREVACATYAEVLKQYPADASRLAKRVSREQAAAKC